MQDDDEKYRAEQEQRRHQNQSNDQKVKATPWGILGARIDHQRGGSGRHRLKRWRDLQFRNWMIW